MEMSKGRRPNRYNEEASDDTEDFDAVYDDLKVNINQYQYSL
jgi:hypothetical protein